MSLRNFQLLIGIIFLFSLTLIIPSADSNEMVNETYIETTHNKDKINKHVTETKTILWSPQNAGNVSDIKVNGEIYGPGDVEVTLIKGGKEFLIYKRSLTEEDHKVQDYVKDSHGNNIGLKLSYGDGNWDEDNDGVATYDDGVDFKINPIFFLDYNEDNLCTIWDVYSSEEYNSACYGAKDCCNHLGFSSTTDQWNQDFVLVKDKYGAKKNNFVLARVVRYGEESVDYSNYDGLSASFVDDKLNKKLKTEFDTLYESENYFLKITLEKDTFFYLKNVEYTTKSVKTRKVEKEDNESEKNDTNESTNNVTSQEDDTKETPKNESYSKDIFEENKTSLYLKKETLEKDYSIEPNKSVIKEIKFHNTTEDFILNLSINSHEDTLNLKPEQDKDVDVTYKIKLDKEEFDQKIKAFNCNKNDLNVQNVLSTSDYKYVKVNSALCDLTLTSKEVKSLSEGVSPEKFSEPETFDFDFLFNPLTYFLAACVIALIVWIVGSRKD